MGSNSSAKSVCLFGAGVVSGLVLARLGRKGWLVRKEDEDDVGMSVESLARKNIRELQPYRCARDDYADGVLLDANENAVGPALTINDGVVSKELISGLNRYPDPYQGELKKLVGKMRGVGHENIFVGVGSDEAIDLLFRVFCEPRISACLIMPPTYGMYKVCAAANDISVLSAPLEPETFDIDVPKVLKTVTPATRLVFVTSPGNPTSRMVSRDKLIELLQKLPRTTLLVVDEAYLDFASNDASVSPLVHQYSRLVVLHTLSKAFGLAGVRCGTAIAHPHVISLMNNLKAPYNVNSITSKIACQALADQTPVRATINLLIEERTSLVKALQLLPYVEKVYPSDANFLLVKFRPADRAKVLYKTLADAGVVVRFRGDQVHCTGCLRITVGTKADNDALLAKLNELAPAIMQPTTGAKH